MPVRLKVVEGPNAGTIYFFGEGEKKVFGRASNADIQIVDPMISRNHVLVKGTLAGGVVIDLESSNGTFVNGRLVKEAHLETGDRIQFGSVVLDTTVERRAGAPGAGDKVETVRGLMFCTSCHRAVILGEQMPPPWEPFVCEDCKAGKREFDRGLIDPYRLLEKVAEDPIGPVYRAEHTRTGRKALVRFFAPPDETIEARELELFLREASIAARLRHPNIVETVDAGERRGVYYIVEELLEGEDLEQRMKRAAGAALPLEEALHIAAKVAAALEFAFAQGIVHRNVRPSSIFVSEYGGVKLGRFGLAKSLTGAASKTGITKATDFRGHANYLPPEQLLSVSTVDQRADIYALGATLYHMVTGRPPFEAPSAMQVVRRIGEGALEPVARLAPQTPPAVAGVIERAMEREPARRFQTPRELASAIDSCRARLGFSSGR